jgi:hypothetical protein
MNRNPSESMMRPKEARSVSVCGISSGHSAGGDSMRCDCGSLLARLVPAGVELKCRRCKRIVVLPIAPA